MAKRKVKPIRQIKNPFTVKEITIRNKSYIAVWIKGKRGFFSLSKKRKGINVSNTKKTLAKTQEIKEFVAQESFTKALQIFRVLQAKIFEGNNYRLGQIRVWVITINPDKYTSKLLNKIIASLQIKYNKFLNYSSSTLIARESKRINDDEVLTLDSIFISKFDKAPLVHRRVKQKRDIIFFQIIGTNERGGLSFNLTGVWS